MSTSPLRILLRSIRIREILPWKRALSVAGRPDPLFGAGSLELPAGAGEPDRVQGRSSVSVGGRGDQRARIRAAGAPAEPEERGREAVRHNPAGAAKDRDAERAGTGEAGREAVRDVCLRSDAREHRSTERMEGSEWIDVDA